MTRSQWAWLNRAMGLALKSRCKHRHGALIVKGGSVLTYGVNSDRGFWSEHAEFDAIYSRTCGMEALRGATCYVARVNKLGQPMLSRPCAECMRDLRKHGIRKVIYTPGVEERL